MVSGGNGGFLLARGRSGLSIVSHKGFLVGKWQNIKVINLNVNFRLSPGQNS